jgi:hypothetical protein
MPRSRSISRRRSRSLSRRSSRGSRSRSPRLSPRPFSLSPLVAERSACVGQTDLITLNPITEDDLIEYTQVHEGRRKHFCFSKSALKQWASINPIHPTTRVPLPQRVLDELNDQAHRENFSGNYYSRCFLDIDRDDAIRCKFKERVFPQVFTVARDKNVAEKTLLGWMKLWINEATTGSCFLRIFERPYRSLYHTDYKIEYANYEVGFLRIITDTTMEEHHRHFFQLPSVVPGQYSHDPILTSGVFGTLKVNT